LNAIYLSGLWQSLANAELPALTKLASFAFDHEAEISDHWNEHYYSLCALESAPYASDAAWDAIFVLAYRPFLTADRIARGLQVFNSSLDVDARSVNQVLDFIHFANINDMELMSANWQDINDLGEDAQYQDAIRHCRFPFDPLICAGLTPEELMAIDSSVTNLLVACCSRIPVTARAHQMLIAPVLDAISKQVVMSA